jgi:hypothetical protein
MVEPAAAGNLGDADLGILGIAQTSAHGVKTAVFEVTKRRGVEIFSERHFEGVESDPDLPGERFESKRRVEMGFDGGLAGPFSQGTGHAGQSEVLWLSRATCRDGNNMVDMKGGLLTNLRESAVFAGSLRPLDRQSP